MVDILLCKETLEIIQMSNLELLKTKSLQTLTWKVGSKKNVVTQFPYNNKNMTFFLSDLKFHIQFPEKFPIIVKNGGSFHLKKLAAFHWKMKKGTLVMSETRIND